MPAPLPDVPDDLADRPDLRALTLDQAQDLAVALGLPRFRGEQAWRWVHGRGATSWDEMTNLGAAVRERLAAGARIGTLTLAEVQRSRDGTRKLRFTTRDGYAIESVLIPDGDKTTQCISSQVGCAVDCQFCATAKLGLTRNLDPGEIADQVYRARALLAVEEPDRRITNLVYMGMGEPLHNYDHVMRSLRILTHDLGAGLSQRRITVSTAGLVPRLEKLGREDVRPNLAVSLNAASDEVRDQIMPINRKWNIGKLLAAIRAYPLEHRRRVTFEYVLLAGVNDALTDAADLARLLRGQRCKVNLIPWNPHPEAPYRRPAPEVIEAFQNECKRLGLPTYLRTPRGDDIDAACGQLANRTNGELLVPLGKRPARGERAPSPPAID
ncbi:MAG: 23S rRNA (adenine(2503)-C(2))-methyltransferase RlmN [Kofleriaceae bacterium]|nr:23S rRNA (adenine(2503)-C(2))-methyltransferase RlmN [Kofleriaceae bacterium]MCL4227510.1 23S rRNA (adenine(2503)-C(2))-methyltransferase RlmN [Myxococcales bacterium]